MLMYNSSITAVRCISLLIRAVEDFAPPQIRLPAVVRYAEPMFFAFGSTAQNGNQMFFHAWRKEAKHNVEALGKEGRLRQTRQTDNRYRQSTGRHQAPSTSGLVCGMIKRKTFVTVP